jgi:hypothetical protein
MNTRNTLIRLAVLALAATTLTACKPKITIPECDSVGNNCGCPEGTDEYHVPPGTPRFEDPTLQNGGLSPTDFYCVTKPPPGITWVILDTIEPPIATGFRITGLPGIFH